MKSILSSVFLGELCVLCGKIPLGSKWTLENKNLPKASP